MGFYLYCRCVELNRTSSFRLMQFAFTIQHSAPLSVIVIILKYLFEIELANIIKV